MTGKRSFEDLKLIRMAVFKIDIHNLDIKWHPDSEAAELDNDFHGISFWTTAEIPVENVKYANVKPGA